MSTRRLSFRNQSQLTTLRKFQIGQIHIQRLMTEINIHDEDLPNGEVSYMEVVLPSYVVTKRLVGRLRELYVVEGGREWQSEFGKRAKLRRTKSCSYF